MNKKIIACFLFLFGFLFNMATVVAYSPDCTHPALTRAVADYYNRTRGNVISASEIDELAAGAKYEDLAPRWVNHFYDPVYDRGWTDKLGVLRDLCSASMQIYCITALSSPDWALSSSAQLTYGFFEGDYSWPTGVQKGKEGYLFGAQNILGHILHLTEDATVPAHVRDDTHVFTWLWSAGLETWMLIKGDPLEVWIENDCQAGNLSLDAISSRITSTPAINDLKSAMKFVAQETNKTFFSADTISEPKYTKPIITAENIESRPGADGLLHKYAIGVDSSGQEYRLARESKAGRYLLHPAFTLDYACIRDNWERSAELAITYGAAIVDLYLRSIAAARRGCRITDEGGIDCSNIDARDGGLVASDGGVVIADGGIANRDGGIVIDGGFSPPDGGIAIRDGGVVSPDGGMKDGGVADGGARDGGMRDGGVFQDGGLMVDGGTISDGGTLVMDGGAVTDGGHIADGGVGDGETDGGLADGGFDDDGGVEDGGADAGVNDGGCIPDCQSKECGENGCGGNCGVCDDILGCTRDQCINNLCVYNDECAVGTVCSMAGCIYNGRILIEDVSYSSWSIYSWYPAQGSQSLLYYPSANGSYYMPSCAPDGEKFAFAFHERSYYYTEDKTNIGIFTFADGGVQWLTNNSWQEYSTGPSWSPDGLKIVYIAGDSLMLLNLENRETEQIYRGHLSSRASWSPDSAWITFASGGIIKLNIATKEIVVLMNEMYDDSPDWSPDGEWVAFSRKANYSSPSNIWLIKSDGSEPQQLTNYSAGQAAFPVWSPDNEKILFFYLNANNDEMLRIINKDGSDDKVFLDVSISDGVAMLRVSWCIK